MHHLVYLFWCVFVCVSTGTVMTPNYVQNSSMDVSLWCNCEGSGNHWQDCQHLQHLFTDNTCLSEFNTHTHTHTHTHTPLSASLAVSQLSTSLKYIQKGIHFLCVCVCVCVLVCCYAHCVSETTKLGVWMCRGVVPIVVLFNQHYQKEPIRTKFKVQKRWLKSSKNSQMSLHTKPRPCPCPVFQDRQLLPGEEEQQRFNP